VLKKFVNRFVGEQEGATMVEYAIMVALIAVISILVVAALGQKVASNFDKTQQEMPDPPTPVAPT
jgi:pilus assembly protein Flp/PilA